MIQMGKKNEIRRTSYGGLEIECVCSNPPWRLFRQVKTCLNWINKDDLQGLGKIILTDEVINAETITNDAASRRGFYEFGTENSPPVIYLTIPEFYKFVPSWLRWSPLITLRICRTLAHEVGHHVSIMNDDQLKIAAASQAELLATNYAASVIELMTRGWYYKMGRFLIREIAEWYFIAGLVDAKYECYQRAAKRFYAAWHLAPEMENAATYYWGVRRAYEKEAGQNKRIT